MTNKELIAAHDESTKFCSFMSHIREASSTYDKIIEKGKEIVPDILEYLRETQGGVSIMLLLMDIIGISPYTPEKEIAGFVSINVEEARKAWIQWELKKNLFFSKRTV